MNAKEALSLKRRRNAKMFATYKMISWDLLFFYSVQFLFYTQTKMITASEALIVEGIYQISRIFMQFPAIKITEKLGRKKSIVCGNIIVIIYLIILITGKGAIGIIIADIFCALGYNIKSLSETVLLYDSVATKGGSGLYAKIDSKGSSMYFMLDRNMRNDCWISFCVQQLFANDFMLMFCNSFNDYVVKICRYKESKTESKTGKTER